MDNRPIGVFDSGVGGLTAVRELEALLPRESIIYFGDTGRVPYGGRSRETILRYARQDIAFLRSFDLKAVVVACGTVSSTVIEQLQRENALPIFGVVEPTALRASEVTGNGHIGLIATKATIKTGAYERIIRAHRPEAQIFSRSCPLFVPLVENGRTRPGDVVIETVTAEYLAPLRDAGVDTLVLGCTHYPLLRDVIGRYMGKRVRLLDSGAEVAREVASWLEQTGQTAQEDHVPTHDWYVSDTPDSFSSLASIFLGRTVTERVQQVSL